MTQNRTWKYQVPERGSTAVQALEAAWELLRELEPTIPPAVLTFVDVGSRGHVHGYFARSIWKKRRGRAHEIGISPKLIGDSKGMLATILHEAAHAVLSDAGKRGGLGSTPYYHTKVFRDQARTFGLDCVFLNTSYGWTLTSWPSGRVPGHYKPVDSLLRERLPAGLGKPTPMHVEGRKLPPSGHTMLVCGCIDANRTIYVKKSVLESGGVMCSFCGKAFLQPHTK